MSEPEKREAWVEGLRQLADFVEAHPEMPLPMSGATLYLWGADAKTELAALVRILGNVEKEASESFFGVTRRFGPHALSVKASRENVCQRVVVGTKTETYQVPPEGIEMVERTRSVELVEWICPPSILALAGDSPEAATA